MKRLLLPPTVWLFSIAAMLVVHEWLPLLHIQPHIWRTSIGLTIFTVALGVTIVQNRIFTTEQTNIDTFGKPDRLVEIGLLKWIRNPMYLGFVASLAALALIMGALFPWFFVLIFFLIADRWYIPYEERAMQERFGHRHDGYFMRTRRWF